MQEVTVYVNNNKPNANSETNEQNNNEGFKSPSKSASSNNDNLSKGSVPVQNVLNPLPNRNYENREPSFTQSTQANIKVSSNLVVYCI